MSNSVIYISEDLETIIKSYMSYSQLETITHNAYKEEEYLNNLTLAIISNDIKYLSIALEISKIGGVKIILIKSNTPQNFSVDDIVKIAPILLLPLPETQLEFELNFGGVINELENNHICGKKSEIWLKGVLNSIKDAVLAIDEFGNIIFMNPVAQHIIGIEESKSLGLPIERVVKLKNLEDKVFTLLEFEENCDSKVFEGELINRITKGSIQVSGNITRISHQNGTSCGKVISFKDVGEIKSLFSRINYQSSHDNLTGILNRKSFINFADQLITLSKYDDSVHGLLIISLDKFKIINDTCGHQAGDELLRKVAYLIKSIDKNNNFILGRIGGDEFAVLFKNKSLSEVKHFTKSIKRKISTQEFIWGEKEFQIMSSYGIVTITKSTIDHYNLLAAADDAIAIAKEKGCGKIEIYNDIGAEYNRRRDDMHWIHKLKSAIRDEKFQLFYQDIQSTKYCETKKIEILVRLKNDSGEIISPIDFIPSAEHYGIMPDIDKIIIEKSISACKNIIENKRLNDNYMFSVNISGSSIPDKTLPGFILSMFQKYKVPPTLFCFEITETSAITNMGLAESFIDNLKRIGCRFSLDDFGSGFSNFTYLRNLDVDYLKIDGSFIVDMLDEPINKEMVESINNIGHIMNMKTIAEFVESEEIKNALIEIGVDFLQGYIISKPTPIENLFI